MATEKITILKVDTGEAVSSVRDLKENIKILKEQLLDTELGTQEYQETLKELKENQNALKDAMYATTASFEDITNAATGANVAFNENNELVNMQGVSYNALVHTLADLKQAWRATTDETERAKLGEKINNVNNQLKTMDASVGNYQRNVGNYIGAVDHLTGAFGSMGKGAQSVINPIKGATNGLKAMSQTPVIAILGLLATILGKVIDALKTSEESTNAMTAAMAPLSAIGDAVTKVMQGLGAVVASLAGGFTKLMGAIFGTNEATRQRLALAEAEAKLAQQTRDNIIANALAERDAAAFREQAYDKEKYTAEERLDFAKKAGEKEAEIARRAYEDAKLAYEIQRAKNALTQSSAEEKQKEAEAYAALVKAETSYHKQVTANLKEQNRLRKEIQRERDDAAKKALEAYRQQNKAEQDLLKQEIALTEKGSRDRLTLERQLRAKEYDLAVTEAKKKITNARELNKTLILLKQQYNRDDLALVRKHQKDVEAQEVLHLNNIANQYVAGTLENLKAVRDVRKKELENIRKEDGETVDEWNARRLKAQQAYADASRAVSDKMQKDELTAAKVFAAQRTATEDERLQNVLLAAQAELEILEKYGKKKGETDNEYALRKIEAENAVYDAIKAIEDKAAADSNARLEERKEKLQKYLDKFTATTSAISGLFSGLADMYEADGELTAKEQERVKNLRIAGATIDMLQGAVTAYSTAQTLGVPMGPIVGAINAAAVVAAGMANIAKIKATDTSGNSASSTTPTVPATVSAPTVSTNVTTVRNLTGAAEEDRLNRMADARQVYILSSDLEADRDAVRTRISETTF